MLRVWNARTRINDRLFGESTLRTDQNKLLPELRQSDGERGRDMTDPAAIRVLKDMLKEMTLMRKAIQRMAPPPRELDIPDLETYCEMLEEGEDGDA